MLPFAIGYYNSPIGLLCIESNEFAVTRIAFQDEKTGEENETAVIRMSKMQLNEYFQNCRLTFSFPFHQTGTDFQQKVWNELANIPFGVQTSYHDLSVKIGNPKGVRAVAAANGKNNLLIVVPCHRVIGKNGSMTGYSGGVWRKEWLHNHELEIRKTKEIWPKIQSY